MLLKVIMHKRVDETTRSNNGANIVLEILQSP